MILLRNLRGQQRRGARRTRGVRSSSIQGAGRFALCLLLVFLAACLSAGCLPARTGGDASGAAHEASEEFFAMDTKMTVRVYGEGAADAVKAAKERLLALDALWSPTREGSDVARLNESAGKSVAPAPETMKLLLLSRQVSEATDGALDVTLAPLLGLWGFTGGDHRVPSAEEIAAAQGLTGAEKLALDEAAGTARLAQGSSVELGAVAKGYAGELAAAELKARGVRSALLDLGGNIETVGARPDGTPWRVGLRNPFGGALLGTVAVEDSAVVTSAIDQRFFVDAAGNRYWHILDPATSAPARSGLASVTVVAKSGGRADALSTALFVMGAERAAAFWRARQDFEMVLVGMDGHVQITPGLAACFTAGEGMTGEAEVIR